jgi:hypothetical protein
LFTKKEGRRKKEEGRNTHMNTHVGLKQGHCFSSRYADSKNIFFFTEALNSERAFLLAIPSSFFLLIPFLCEAAYITPRLRRPPLARGDYRGVLIMCIFIQNWYYFFLHL